MTKEEDILSFFILICFVVIEIYFVGYILGSLIFLIFGIILFFVFGIVGVVANEATKQSYIVKREYDYAIRQNGGNIDGARIKFGNNEVYVEGPRNSFWKGMKYIFTGEEEYSTKFKIAGKEVGKIKVNSNGRFKLKMS